MHSTIPGLVRLDFRKSFIGGALDRKALSLLLLAMAWVGSSFAQQGDKYLEIGDKYFARGDHSKAWTFYYYAAKDGSTEDLRRNAEERKTSCESVLVAKEGSFTDRRDGRTYRTTILSNGQEWMRDNLNYRLYASVSERTKRRKKNERAPITIDDGQLYTFREAQSACPAGWRLPSKSDYEKLLALYDYPSDEEEFVMRIWGFIVSPSYLQKGGFAKFDPQKLGCSRTSYSGVEENSDYSNTYFFWTSTVSDNAVYDTQTESYRDMPYYFSGGRILDYPVGVNSTYANPKMPCRCVREY